MSPARVRVAVVADIHCGPDRDGLLGSRCPALLDGFLEAMRAARPACIVDLGDRINSVASGQDGVRERYVHRRLSEAGVPVCHLLGNTDVRRLPKHEALAAVERDWAAEAVDLGPVRLILLDTVDPVVAGVGGAMSAAQVDWLRVTLAQPAPPCFVFGHHPLDEPALTGHRYFADRPDRAAVCHRVAVRAVVERSSAVLGVFAGHLHRTAHSEINGVHYVTVGSLVEGAYTDGEPCGAYALVDAGHGRTDVTVYGRRPEAFTLPG